MKKFGTIALLVGLAISVKAASTDPRSVDSSTVSKRITKYCDPVCELKAQDSAFSLLIEAYRQFQSRQIQIDYETRLRSAANLGKEADSLVISTTLNSTRTLRAWVEVLAEKERDLRLEQLQGRVVNFSTVYNCARRSDNAALDQPVANQTDPETASEQLKTLRVLALGSPTKADLRAVTSVPAATLFLDSPPVDVPADQLIQPCE
jgi:hypothetical protein